MPPCFQIYTDLERLPLGCGELFESAKNFGLSLAWFRNMILNGLPFGSKPYFVVLMKGTSPIAIVPFEDCGSAGLKSLTNCYSCIYQPLIADQVSGFDTARLLGEGIGRLCARQSLVKIDCLPSNWPALKAFSAGLRAAGLAVRRFQHFGNWYEPIQERSWEEYLTSRPGNLRELLRRRGRKAARAGGVSFEIINQDGDRLSRGIEAYEAVYRRSWKLSEPFPRFNAGLMREAAQVGMLRLGICWRQEKPIAAQIWIVAHRTATVMKLAHDETDHALSPGTLLTATVIEHLIREGVTEIDFGRGDDEYKRLWTERRRQRIGVLLANPRRFKGLAAVATHDMGRAVRALRRRIDRVNRFASAWS